LQHKKIGTKTRQNIWMERAKFLLQHHCSILYNIHSSSCNIETMLLQHQIHAGATRKKNTSIKSTHMKDNPMAT